MKITTKVMKKVVMVLALLLITAMVAGCVESSTLESTPTPTVTATPTPTPTPTATPTAASELEYLDKIMGLNERTSYILARDNDATTDFVDGKISLATFEYIVTDCSEDMNAVANEAAFLSPPPGYEEFHGHWIKSVNLYNSAMFEMTLFFEDGDVNHIYIATDMLEEGTKETRLATAALL